jgi:hypothetical protein
MRTAPRRLMRSKWFLPLFCGLLGLLLFGAEAVGGDTGAGLVSLGILSAAGALLLVGGRSETVRGLRGDGRDERFQRLDVNATAFAGTIVILAIIVAFLVELAQGKNGSPYGWLGALGGLAYIAAVIVMRVRN